MKPPPFEYFAPRSEEEALQRLAEYGWDAKLLAGGQSLIPAMNFRLARPAVLVDLNRIDSLRYVEDAEGGLRIGAMTRQAVVERDGMVAARAPLLAAALPHLAHPQIRSRGTIGGSLAHADPAAELPAVMVALGARLRIVGPDGERWIDAADFFIGLFTTALMPGEMLVEVRIPPTPSGARHAFLEVARRHGDYALAGVALQLQVDAEGRCSDARIVLLSVGDGPVVAGGCATALIGRRLDAGSISEAAAIAAIDDIDPPGDLHASPEYRRHLVRVLARRALESATSGDESR